MRKIPKYLIVIMVVSTLLLLYFPASLAALPLVVYVDDSNTSGPWDGTQASPYKTIQDGLDNVAEEGAVYVAPGNYNETIDIDFGLSTTSFDLIGSGSGSTVINGSGHTDPVVAIYGNGWVTIEGFTITNGTHDSGAGILNQEGIAVTLKNCIISNNHATSLGGGIYHSGSAAFNIDSCTVSGNYAASGYTAGGIFNSGVMIIGNSIIKDNYAGDGSLSGTGGGIYNIGDLTIHNSSIVNNRTYSPGSSESSGIYVSSSLDATYNWWGSSSGPYNPVSNPGGAGDAVLGTVVWEDYYPWLTYDPFGGAAEGAAVWVRTMPMTCYRVWINEDNSFQFLFWYPYKNNNWVRIYDMEGKMVFEVDLPWDDPNLVVDLPDGMYTVKTYHDSAEPIQEFVIGKPAPDSGM